MLFVWQTFVQTFPLSLTDPLRGGFCYSSFELQSCALVTWRVGAELGVKSSVPPPPTTPARCPDLRHHRAGRPPANWLWQMPCAAFAEILAGLSAADIRVGRCLDACHSKRSPHPISFTWSPLEMQVPRPRPRH